MIDPLLTASIEYGGLLSIMCLGLTVTYQTTKVPNFAFSDFAVIGMNASYFSFAIFRLGNTYLSIPFGFVAGGVFSVAMYVVVMRPLIRRNSSIVVLMIATLAVDIVFTGVAQDIVYVGGSIFYKQFVHVGLPTLVDAPPLPDFRLFGESGLLLMSPLLLVITTLSMYLLLTKSRFGIAMRASIENPNLAKTVGINVERVYLVSWFVAGALAGVAGSLYTIWDGMSLGIQSVLILDIFAGSVLGGLSSIYGAVLGGLVVAFAENALLGWLSLNVNTGFSLLEVGGASMIMLIITLLVAPRGIVGVNWKRFDWRKR
ncbi:MAG TPA: branched-chain amino acid ABC transporter permease [Nitrososphaerales archaeon]|nr:branched-chain amino acid ABC transporter permease [Nitrososphaerales archaeon]